jgi:UDP-3-O-[3-hydroxymyristoyl] glucosamine N-acyltransferase
MTTKEIADLISGKLIGDGSVEILRVAALETAAESDLAFAEIGRDGLTTNAGCVIVSDDFDTGLSVPFIKVRNPKLAFAKIAGRLQPTKFRNDGRHPTANIDPTSTVKEGWIGAFATVGGDSQIGKGCQIHEGVRIGANVKIGEGTIIYPNCVIYDNVSIGKECIIHAGAVIGAPGFGYVKDEVGEYHQFPQIGKVVIEDRVEIGANSCVDRGALSETRIGEGAKIDNLVQIGHNVQIGKRVVIASQTGISGSVTIEDDCVIGGQVGFGDHVRVQSGAVIGSQAGVLPGKIVRPGVWWGTPIQPLKDYKRQNAHVKSLPRLKEELKKLREDLDRLNETL